MINQFLKLSDNDLVAETKRAVLSERSATVAVLERLREIKRRLVHLEIGYSSLHEFCVVELGYSDGAAYRRIHAMELCEELPQAKDAITDGRLSLTNAAGLQKFLSERPESHPTAEAKEALLAEIEGKSKRECERLFYPGRTGQKIEFFADDETVADLKRLSELLVTPSSDYAALLKRVAKLALKAIDPVAKKTRLPVKILASPEKLVLTAEANASSETLQRPVRPVSAREWPSKRVSRYISAADKKAVWIRDNSRCSYVSPVTGRRCTSRYGLQIDHVVPVALGGTSTLENLRILCMVHNHFEAVRIFGRHKMAKFNPALSGKPDLLRL